MGSPTNLPRQNSQSVAAGRLQKVPLCLLDCEIERGKQGVNKQLNYNIVSFIKKK